MLAVTLDEPRAPGGVDAAASESVWAPHRRRLTLGLVFTITLVAFEALAISTVMPVVADDLGGLGALRVGVQRLLPGEPAGHRARRPGGRPAGNGRAVPRRPGPVRRGAVHRRPGAVDGRAGGGADPPGHRRRRDPGHRVRERRPGVPSRHPATRVRGVLLGMGDPGADRTRREQRHRRGGHAGAWCSSRCCPSWCSPPSSRSRR